MRPTLLIVLIAGNLAQFVVLYEIHGEQGELREQVLSALDERQKIVMTAPAVIAQALPQSGQPATPLACPVCDCAAATKPEDHQDSTPKPDSQAAVEASNAVIDHALPTGMWTSDDIRQLRHQMPRLNEEARGVIITRVLSAIMDGQLRLEQPGPPL